ncbi:MAG TPA: ComEC/Rec2 family competence protein [Rhabdochlamydiaceae bacterium]|nr:ComEC/Rec2 family competence protein [Rhabdochlamydiaceae bacterium]
MKNTWLSAPALFYGILFLIGIVFALSFHPAYFFPLILCLYTYPQKLLSGLLACLAGWTLALLSYTLPDLKEEGFEGSGTFKVESVSYSHSPFERSVHFKGILQEFSSDQATFKNIPCRIYFRHNQPQPLGSTDLHVTGKLFPKGHHRYVLKVHSWEIAPTSRLAEWRFNLKNKLRAYLSRHFTDAKSRAFLTSMLTGDIDDRLLALEFNRLGILHLLGISGFQFALLAFLLGSFFRLILPYNAASLFLILFLTAYAFILGDSPPIERAWIGISLYLAAQITGWRISALNALGIALLWQLAKDPLLIFHLGFQFSFLCTAAILVTYPLFRSWLTRFFPHRHFKELIQMPFLDQHGHLLSFFCRETLALNGAIHLVTLPLILFHFHKFPVLSLLYNLFLPAAVSLVYLFLIVGVALPFIGSWVHILNRRLTKLILQIATHPPALYEFQWRMHDFSMTAAVTAITVILGFSVFHERAGRLIKRLRF